MIETNVDPLQLLGFTEEEAKDIRKKKLNKVRKARKKTSVAQTGFKKVYERMKANE